MSSIERQQLGAKHWVSEALDVKKDKLLAKLSCFKTLYRFFKMIRLEHQLGRNVAEETIEISDLETLSDPRVFDVENLNTMVNSCLKALSKQISNTSSLTGDDETVAPQSRRKAVKLGEKRDRAGDSSLTFSRKRPTASAAIVKQGPKKKILKGRRLTRNQLFLRFFAVYFTVDLNAFGYRAFQTIHLWPPCYSSFSEYRKRMQVSRQEGRNADANLKLKGEVSHVMKSVVNFSNGAEKMIKFKGELSSTDHFRTIVDHVPEIPRVSRVQTQRRVYVSGASNSVGGSSGVSHPLALDFDPYER
jgi:hypothetical protein